MNDNQCAQPHLPRGEVHALESLSPSVQSRTATEHACHEVSRMTAARNAVLAGAKTKAPARGEAFAAAFQHAAIGIAVGTTDSRLRDANPAFLRMLGYTLDEVRGALFASITHPDDREADLREWNRLASGEIDVYHREKQYLRKDGSSIWGEVSVTALRDEAGQFGGTVSQVQDISSRKAVETALRQHEAQIETLVEQLPVLVYSHEIDEANTTRYVSPRLEEILGVGSDGIPTSMDEFIQLVHPDDRAKLLAVVQNTDRSMASQIQFRMRGAGGDWVWMEHQVSEARQSEGSTRTVHGSLLDITERVRLNLLLQENEARYRLAFAGSPIGMAMATPDQICLEANEVYCEIVGLPMHALIGHRIDVPLHPDDAAESQRQHARLVAGEVDSYATEVRYVRPDGSHVWGMLTVSAARNEDGSLRFTLSQLQNITAQKSAEAALRSSEDLLRNVISDTPAAMYRYDLGPPGQYTFVSPRFESMTGIRQGYPHFSTFNAFRQIHPDDVATLVAAEAHSDRTAEPFDCVYRFADGQGSWTWVHERATATLGEQGKMQAWHGILLDITEQKRLEEALRENESRLRLLVEQLPAALYTIEPGAEPNYTYVSPQFYDVTGITLDEARQRGSEAFLERVHPTDLALVRQATAHALATGEPFDVAFRLRDAHERWKWVRDRAIVERDAQGGQKAWHGVILDITQGQEFQEQRARLQVLVNQLPVALYSMTTGKHPRFTYGSPQFEALTGLAVSAMPFSLKDFYARIHPEDVDAVRAGDDAAFRTLVPLHMAYRIRNHNDEWLWVQDRATVARDAHGRPIAWHGVLLDISEQRRLEESVRESEQRFRSIFIGASTGKTLSSPQGAFLMANPALERLLGYKPGELIGVDSLTITIPEDRAQQIALRDKMAAGEIDQYQLEKSFVRRDGSTVTVLLDATAIRDEYGVLQNVIGQVQDVTARKAAEAALRESEQRFRSMFENAGIGMVLTNADGEIQVANAAFADLLGYAVNDLQGLNMAALTAVADREAEAALCNEAARGERDTFHLEKRYVRRDGSLVWTHVDFSALRDDTGQMTAMIGQVQDITARREAELALRASEGRFRALVQNDPDVTILIDANQHITYASPSAWTIFDADAADIYGSIEQYFGSVHQDDLEAIRAAYSTPATEGPLVMEREIRIHHQRLGWRWLQITMINLLADPDVRAHLIKLRDINDRKEAELATAIAMDAQRAAIAELERLNRSKSRFLSTISHEFRTPLTAIIGYSEFMATNSSSPELIAEDAGVIHREANRLNRMVDDVLLIDRVDSGHVTISIRPVDLNAMILAVSETFRPLLERHTLSFDLDITLPPVAGDADRLSQAVTNLLSNAVKYSPNGGSITITTSAQGGEAVIAIHDEGIGIPPEDLDRIFDRFERVETGISGRIAGTGLGLSIVRELAHLHGGRVWVESVFGLGSVFYLAIPFNAHS